MSYYIKYPSKNANVTEIWSASRLPFEPKGWLYDMREELKRAIKEISLDDSRILSAVYISQNQGFCDIENILIYNVGPGVFKDICRNGLLLERGYQRVVSPSGNQESYGHYQSYSLVGKRQDPLYWKEKRVLASWKGIFLEKMPTKPHDYWRLMKENQVFVADAAHNGKYGIEIVMQLPVNSSNNFAGLIKPMLDGIIAAFHSYSGNDLVEVSRRLASVLPVQAEGISAMLIDKKIDVLGSRSVVRPYRNFVQWNPADDKCMVIKLVNNFISENRIIMDGRIFVIE